MTVVDRGESAAEDADRGAQAPVSTPGRGSVVAPRLLNALPVLARFLVLGVQRFTLGGTK